MNNNTKYQTDLFRPSLVTFRRDSSIYNQNLQRNFNTRDPNQDQGNIKNQLDKNYGFVRSKYIEEKQNSLSFKKQYFKPLLNNYRDPSYQTKVYKRQKDLNEKISHFYNILLRQKDQERIISLNSNWLFFWNLLVVVSILFNIFQIPIATFFTEQVYHDQFRATTTIVINWLFIFVLFFNTFLVRPNTQFQYLGYLVNSRKQIINNYIGIKLLIDVFGFIVVFIYGIFFHTSLIYFKFLFYLELLTLFDTDTMLQKKLELKNYTLAVYKIVRYLVYLLFIVIWLSCIYFFIDYQFYLNNTYPVTQNWLTNSICTFSVDAQGNNYPTNLIEVYPWYVWLDYAMYWSLQTISNLGYGDMTPKNPPSVVFTNISIFIMILFFVFFIKGILEIIGDIKTPEIKQNEINFKKMKELEKEKRVRNNLMNLQLSINKEQQQQQQNDLNTSISKFRRFIIQMDIQKFEVQDNIETIIQKNLSPDLRQQLLVNKKRLFFKNVYLFGQIAAMENDSIKIYEQLIYKVKEEIFGEDQIIYERGVDKPFLYFLIKGAVNVSYPHSKYERLYIKFSGHQPFAPHFDPQNYNFGVTQFFLNNPKQHTAKTISYSKIEKLSYSDMIETIKMKDKYYEIFCELRDQLRFQRRVQLTGEQCYECKSFRHGLFECHSCKFNFKLNIKPKRRLVSIPITYYSKQKRHSTIKSRRIFTFSENFKKDHSQIQVDQLKNYSQYTKKYNLQ